MKQVHLISSGVQLRFKPVLDVSGDRFAYCSTLAAYVHSLPHGDLERLLACHHDRNIACFAFSPHDADLVVTCAATKLYLWRLSTERQEKMSQHTDVDITHFHLSPHRPVVAFALIDGCVGLWNTDSNTTRLISAGTFHVISIQVIGFSVMIYAILIPQALAMFLAFAGTIAVVCQCCSVAIVLANYLSTPNAARLTLIYVISKMNPP
jgi:WD40 repeat protein